MKYLIYAIKSFKNPDVIFIGCTTKQYMCDVYNNYLYLYKAYKKGIGRRYTCFDVFDCGNTYYSLLEEIDTSEQNIKYYVRKHKRQYPNNYLGIL